MSNLVLWGHHLDEYNEMFDLNSKDLSGRILEFGSGPSAFNIQSNGVVQVCTSCDPLFALDKATLKSKSDLIFADMAEKISNDKDIFDFSSYGKLDNLLEKRREGMAAFFADYNTGKKEGRYVTVQDMELPFADFSFDLALCSHYLFGEIENQDVDFHVRMIKELARVAKEVRIFPLIDRYGTPSPFLGPVLLALQQENYGSEVKTVAYHLQPQGNAMLRVWAQQCQIE